MWRNKSALREKELLKIPEDEAQFPSDGQLHSRAAPLSQLWPPGEGGRLRITGTLFFSVIPQPHGLFFVLSVVGEEFSDLKVRSSLN